MDTRPVADLPRPEQSENIKRCLLVWVLAVGVFAIGLGLGALFKFGYK